MKKIILFVFCCLMSACYDDTLIRQHIQDLQYQINELKASCDEHNTNIISINEILAAFQSQDHVTNITPIYENNETIGYTLTFDKYGSITVYSKKYIYTPSIGVKLGDDNKWYWTIDGEWITDDNDNKIQASAKDGITPLLKIDDNYWYVSYDQGITWEQLKEVTADNKNSFFNDIKYDDKYVYMTFTNGETITIPRVEPPVSNEIFFVNKDIPDLTSFNMFGYYSDDEFTGISNSEKYIDNSMFIKNEYSDEYYPQSTKYYWPDSGYLTFVGYSGTVSNPYIDNYGLNFTYTVNEYADEDLLVSEVSYDNTDQSTGVEIDFKQVLSSLSFDIEVEDEAIIEVEKIIVSGLNNKGTFSQGFTDWKKGLIMDNCTWSDLSGSVSLEIPVNDYVCDNDRFMVIPQKISEDSRISVHFGIRTGGGMLLYQQSDCNTSSLLSTFDPAKSYNFSILIKLDEVYFQVNN